MLVKDLFEDVHPQNLYHWCFTFKVPDILTDRYFRLTLKRLHGDGTATLHTKKHWYVLSTSRTPNIGFGGDGGAIFVLNREWIKQHYRVVPANFYSRYNRKPLLYRSEVEERIYSKTPKLMFPPTASDFIKEIHMTANKPDDSSSFDNTLFGVIVQCKKLKIPLYLYPHGELKALDKSRTLDLQAITKELIAQRKESYYEPLPTNRQAKSLDVFVPFRQLYYAKREKDLGREARNYLKFLNNISKFEVSGDLSYELKSARKRANTRDRDLMIRTFRKANVSSVEEFVDLLVKKWHPTLGTVNREYNDKGINTTDGKN